MAAAAPYIIAAVGSGLAYKANQDAANERRTTLNRALESNERATDKASNLVQAEAQRYAPDARQQALTEQEQQAFERSQKDLATGAGGGLIGTAGGNGNVSADFLKTKADRQISEGNELTAIAREVAKTRAPSLLLTKEGQSRANLAGDLQNTFSAARNAASAAGQDAAGIEPAPYGQIAQAVGDIWSTSLSKQPSKAPRSTGGVRYSGAPTISNFA